MQDTEISAQSKRFSDEEVTGAFDMARLLLRNGKLSNLKKVIELFVEEVVVGENGILIKFTFRREHKPQTTPPTGRC